MPIFQKTFQTTLAALQTTLAIAALISFDAMATVVEVVDLGASQARLKIDGRGPITLQVGDFSPEGVYLHSVATDGARLRLRGLDEVLAVGRTVAVSQSQPNQPSVLIGRDADGRYMSGVLYNGQSALGEFDAKLDSILMPAHIADIVKLAYKAPKEKTPAQKAADAEKTPAQLKREAYATPIVVRPKGKKPYTLYPVTFRAIRIGNVEVFNVAGHVTDDPSAKHTKLGKSLLLRLDPLWEDNGLVLTKRE